MTGNQVIDCLAVCLEAFLIQACVTNKVTVIWCVLCIPWEHLLSGSYETAVVVCWKLGHHLHPSDHQARSGKAQWAMWSASSAECCRPEQTRLLKDVIIRYMQYMIPFDSKFLVFWGEMFWEHLSCSPEWTWEWLPQTKVGFVKKGQLLLGTFITIRDELVL